MKRQVLAHLTFLRGYDEMNTTLDHLTFDDTFDGMLQAFLFACQAKELSPRTIEYYEQTLTRFYNFCQGLKINSPAQVTPGHIRLFMVELRKTISAISVHAYYRAIKRSYHFLLREGFVKINPMTNIEAPQRPKILIPPFTKEEITIFLHLCDENTFHGARNKALILLLLDTGLRLSEVASIQLKDVNVKLRTIKVMGKGAKERVVGFSPTTLVYLIRYHTLCGKRFGEERGSRLWLTERGDPLAWRGIQMVIRKIKERSNIKGKRVSAHIFRRTFAVMSLDNDASQDDVQRLLGHETGRMTQLYSEYGRTDKALRNYKKFSPVNSLTIR
jgi:integrase/recombinase XerC